jgi:hypothetical protein
MTGSYERELGKPGHVPGEYTADSLVTPLPPANPSLIGYLEEPRPSLLDRARALMGRIAVWFRR